MTPDDGPLPPPLPIRVRPAAGETVQSYIRRLARANHLRPSLLHVYVRSPRFPAGAIRPQRLAAVSGSTVSTLNRALIFEAAQAQLLPLRERTTRTARLINPVKNILDELAGQCTAWEIWTIVTDEHDCDAPYRLIREYISSRRLAREHGWPARRFTDDAWLPAAGREN
jgi:hypothetical protein